MKRYILIIIGVFFFTTVGSQTIQSPSKKIEVKIELTAKEEITYEVFYKNKQVVNKSKLGFDLKDELSLTEGFNLLKSEQSAVNEVWNPVLGEQSEIKNHFNQIKFYLIQQQTNRKLNIVFKVFNEGVAFRYEFPSEDPIRYFIISNEKTEFNLTDNHKVFWIPGDYDSQEYVYNETKISEIDNSKLNLENGIALKSIESSYRVQSPLMMKTKDGIYLNIFEAAVVNYPVMHLDVDINNFKFTSNLAPNPIGDKAYLRTPSVTPWRTIMISDDARDIVSSSMILNLNEPCALEDTSWIKPMKYVGIWWEMHIGKATWDYTGSQNAQNAASNDVINQGKHGATTQNAKKYIDFAAKYGFDGVLVEGWNKGWEDWFGKWKEDVFDFLTPYPDYDFEEVANYAKSKNVKMIMHHETSGSVANYERHLDRAFNLMKEFDYP
ncbi:MAG: glycoside hydrolase family 97 N-terminal domain-containing protein, partial [Flavobacteriaceae bacterium]|nr:glycoside hydrolase family 97 N-terminal domain-containing protein [Flavobacteriaceae bacterium]